MSEWVSKTLSELCTDISYGYTESASLEKVGPKFLRITDIANGRIVWDKVPFCPISDSNFEKYRLHVGDIVIARTGATTGANYTIRAADPKDLVYASYLIRYQINKELAQPFFIGQILKSKNWRDYVSAIAGGSAQPGANAKQLGRFSILLPPLKDQHAIAEVLSSIDDKIDLLNRQNETLESMAQTLFRHWFIEEADDSWEVASIGDKLKTVLGGTPSKQVEEYWDGDVPWINSGMVNEFRVYKSSRNITVLGFNKSSTKRMPVGTTVVAITGATLGQISLLEIECCANQSVVGIIGNEEIPFWYVHLWITHMMPEIMLNETGGAQNHINKNDINSTKLVVPTKSYLNHKKDTFVSLYKKISLNVMEIETLRTTRDLLIPKLMSGQVRVKQD